MSEERHVPDFCGDDDEALAAHAQGRLAAEAATAVEAHVATCARCADELSWLNTEMRLLRARSKPTLPPEQWEVLAGRIGRRGRWGRRLAWGAAVATLAAGIAVFVTLRPTGREAAIGMPVPPPAASRPSPRQTLDVAITDYERAIVALESEYAARRPTMTAARLRRHDVGLARMRRVVEEGRATAREDIRAGRRVLKAYAAYLRLLQNALLEEETL